MASGLAAAGAAVAVWARDEGRNREAVDRLTGAGGEAAGFRCDVTDAGSAASALAATIERFGPIHSLFANAGVSAAAKPTEITYDEWDRVVGTDLTGVSRVVRPVATHMRDEETAGSIVLTASIFDGLGLPYSAHYSAAKGGGVHLARSLAVYPARHEIRVNVLSPGWVATEMTDEARAHDKSAAAARGGPRCAAGVSRKTTPEPPSSSPRTRPAS
jgi:NAD(P)-dependent dehydrogenase (short-subunit alcohol dehydrogenase family)